MIGQKKIFRQMDLLRSLLWRKAFNSSAPRNDAEALMGGFLSSWLQAPSAGPSPATQNSLCTFLCTQWPLCKFPSTSNSWDSHPSPLLLVLQSQAWSIHTSSSKVRPIPLSGYCSTLHHCPSLWLQVPFRQVFLFIFISLAISTVADTPNVLAGEMPRVVKGPFTE